MNDKCSRKYTKKALPLIEEEGGEGSERLISEISRIKREHFAAIFRKLKTGRDRIRVWRVFDWVLEGGVGLLGVLADWLITISPLYFV